ncbi:MAG: zinc metallopeptidase [Oribacterium sp.]
MYGYFYDSTYILVLLGALIAMWASWNVRSSFRKYEKVGNHGGITGAQAAEAILHGAGICDVRVEHISGSLTDHFSPEERVLRLSDSVYGSRSVAAIGVAAHECGHAMQYEADYFPIHVRAAVIPMANIGSQLSWPLILAGLLLGWVGLVNIGIVLFALVVVFQLVTLPVEFDASGRAIRVLRETAMLNEQELEGAKRVLTAAALTYVAALVSSALQLFRLVLLSQRRRR